MTPGPAPSRRVVVIGPLPPPVHGQSLLGDLMLRLLAGRGHEVMPWSVIGATTAADLGLDRGRKALRLLKALPMDLRRVRGFRPDATVSTIGINDSLAVAVRDCVVPYLVKRTTGATTIGYLCGLPTPDLLSSPWRRRMVARLLGLYDVLLEPYRGALDLVDPALDRDFAPYCSEPPMAITDAVEADALRIRARAQRGVDDDTFAVLFLANLLPGKGATIAIEAVHRLTEMGEKVVLEIVGADTPEQSADELRTMAAALDIADRIRVRGSVPPEDRWHDIAAADVVCLPTSYGAEMMPLALIDGLAAGAGIVSTRWRGIGPTLGDCPVAELTDHPDAASIADAILRLLRRDRAEIRREARRYFNDNLSPEHFGDRLEKALTDVRPVRAGGS